MSAWRACGCVHVRTRVSDLPRARHVSLGTKTGSPYRWGRILQAGSGCPRRSSRTCQPGHTVSGPRRRWACPWDTGGSSLTGTGHGAWTAAEGPTATTPHPSPTSQQVLLSRRFLWEGQGTTGQRPGPPPPRLGPVCCHMAKGTASLTQPCPSHGLGCSLPELAHFITPLVLGSEALQSPPDPLSGTPWLVLPCSFLGALSAPGSCLPLSAPWAHSEER